MKYFGFLIIFFSIIFSSSKCDHDNLLDLTVFKISIPTQWKYKKVKGIDSFIGVISTCKSPLMFDFSDMGYASDGPDTENEFLNSEVWITMCPFCESGVTYTNADNIQKAQDDLMKERGITDRSLVRVEPSIIPQRKFYKPSEKQKIKFPKADYIAELSYKDSVITVPIFMPDYLKTHYITVDTTANFIVKMVLPKHASKGITGIFVRSLKGNLNFNLVGNDLSLQDQRDAENAFKTLMIGNKTVFNR